MIDAAWKRLIDRTIAAHRKADKLRRLAELEYEKRYGANPSDVDDDWWIDTIIGRSEDSVSIAKIKEQAEASCERPRSGGTNER